MHSLNIHIFMVMLFVCVLSEEMRNADGRMVDTCGRGGQGDARSMRWGTGRCVQITGRVTVLAWWAHRCLLQYALYLVYLVCIK